MSKDALSVFVFKDHKVRVTDREGNPWFILTDVCDALDIVNVHQAGSRLDTDERSVCFADTSDGRLREMTVISESGLYTLILRSNKPAAREFRRWVTHEVLPSIRKTGQYIGEHTEARQLGKQSRKQLTDALKEAGVEGWGYGHATNGTYKGLFAGTAKQIEEFLGIPKGKIRDNLSTKRLHALGLAEVIAAETIQSAQIKGNGNCAKICEATASQISRAVPSTSILRLAG